MFIENFGGKSLLWDIIVHEYISQTKKHPLSAFSQPAFVSKATRDIYVTYECEILSSDLLFHGYEGIKVQASELTECSQSDPGSDSVLIQYQLTHTPDLIHHQKVDLVRD
jgi:hypothetical protein